MPPLVRASTRQLRMQLVLVTIVMLGTLLAGCAPSGGTHASGTSANPLAGGGACLRVTKPPYPNVQVTHDTYAAHSEPAIAENPRNPLNLVGGSKYFTDPAHYVFKIGYSYSFDGGCTWTDGGQLPGFGRAALTSDVSFAFDTHNDVYAAVLFTDASDKGGGIAVSRSADGGRTFGQPVTVYADPTGAVFSDKPWIAVDTTSGPRAGAIYIVWSYDTNGACGDGNTCSQGLAFSRSTDGGRTFSPVRQVEGSAPFCDYPAMGRPASSTRCDGALGAIPAVEPDGTLAVANDYIDVQTSGKPTKLVVQTSPDGGDTWSAPTLVTTIADIPFMFRPERYRNFSLPAFASSPRPGELYVTWAGEQHGDADVLFSRSTDNGRTWSAPVRVNDDPPGDGANQFQPALAVAPDGVISVSFFDTRVDPAHQRIDVFLAQSRNGGVSFLPNVRVTTTSFDPAVDAPLDGSGAQFIGDYQGLAADDRVVHPLWNDTRTGKQELFTAAVGRT